MNPERIEGILIMAQEFLNKIEKHETMSDNQIASWNRQIQRYYDELAYEGGY